MSLKSVSTFFWIIMSLLFLPGCFDEKKERPAPLPASVYVKKVIKKDAPVYYDSFGYLSQMFNIDIKSQVTGKILASHFNEGDFVKKGDLLFTIDPSEYQASLDKAKAVLAESESELKLKTLVVDMDKKIAESGALAAQTYAQYQTEQAVVESQIGVDKASIALCQINLDYCQILSPVDGVTGKQEVDPGNIVMGNSGPTLVNVKTIDPLYVDFNVPDRYLASLRDCMSKGNVMVELTPEQIHVAQKTYSAELTFLNNAINNNTGTILLRATIDNKERQLWPGEYVKVRLIFFVQKDATLIPGDAVMNGKDGAYVYLVKDGKACYKMIKIMLRQGDYVMISEGDVKPGDDAVSAGQFGLVDGALVTVLDSSAGSAPAKTDGTEKSGNNK